MCASFAARCALFPSSMRMHLVPHAWFWDHIASLPTRQYAPHCDTYERAKCLPCLWQSAESPETREYRSWPPHHSYRLGRVEPIDQPPKSPTLRPGSLAVKCLFVVLVGVPFCRSPDSSFSGQCCSFRASALMASTCAK